MPKEKLLRHIAYEDGKPPRHVNDQFLDGNSEQAKNARKHNRDAQDEYARSIGMSGPGFEEVQDCLEHKSRLDYIRRTLRTQYRHRLTNEQWAAAKQWYEDHPRD
jgi:hypothetical protein